MATLYCLLLVLTTCVKSWSFLMPLKVRLFQTLCKSTANEDLILKNIDQWACVKNCGACCKLGPLDSRPDLGDYLSKDELDLYKSMIGPDDWCIHFNKEERKCGIYETRPTFCQVDPVRYQTMFDINRDDFSEFCNFCCREQIEDVYGENSVEMSRFNLVALDFNPEEENEEFDESSYEIVDDEAD